MCIFRYCGGGDVCTGVRVCHVGFIINLQIRRACAFAYWNESPEVFQAHVHTYIEDGADTPDRHIAKVYVSVGVYEFSMV